MKKTGSGWDLKCSYSALPEIFYTKTDPNPVSSPQLVILNEALAESLGLNVEELKSKEGIDILAGNQPANHTFLLAQAYAGHQFGHFTMLGDGRAALIGEQLDPSGKRVDIQLKGSGRTAYSRGGDGRAVLGPMLREYIISEAMHSLGIPTTRSLAVVATGEKVYRETALKGAILTRTASSHIRVGTFQFAYAKGSKLAVRTLADYTIDRHFPEVRSEENPYLSLLREVIKAQAELIAKWQLVGFIHGVMNTDNMAISGETIDYGPCAFMNIYDPKTVFSSIDTHGRYAYQNQPRIALWNLTRFAETLLALIDEDEDKAVTIAEDELNRFEALYDEEYINGMRRKLGLFDEEKEDKILIDDLLVLMQIHKADYTNTFVALALGSYENMDMFQSEEFKAWEKRWKQRLQRQDKADKDTKELMKSSNPALIPRNHLVEEALSKASDEDDYSSLCELLDALSRPYDHENAEERYKLTPKPSSVPYKTYCGT